MIKGLVQCMPPPIGNILITYRFSRYTKVDWKNLKQRRLPEDITSVLADSKPQHSEHETRVSFLGHRTLSSNFNERISLYKKTNKQTNKQTKTKIKKNKTKTTNKQTNIFNQFIWVLGTLQHELAVINNSDLKWLYCLIPILQSVCGIWIMLHITDSDMTI